MICFQNVLQYSPYFMTALEEDLLQQTTAKRQHFKSIVRYFTAPRQVDWLQQMTSLTVDK